MENHDKTGSEVHGLIQVEKHTGDDAVDCMKKAIKERAVMQEKVPELRVNRKDTMAMDDIDEFERHRSSTLHGIFIAAGRAVNPAIPVDPPTQQSSPPLLEKMVCHPAV